MNRFTKKLSPILAFLCAAVLLVACESKLTQESFAQIKKGMTVAEVQTILGSSGEVDEAGTGTTISGAGIGGSSKESNETIRVWKEEGVKITIVFVDGKVAETRQEGL